MQISEYCNNVASIYPTHLLHSELQLFSFKYSTQNPATKKQNPTFESQSQPLKPKQQMHSSIRIKPLKPKQHIHNFNTLPV